MTLAKKIGFFSGPLIAIVFYIIVPDSFISPHAHKVFGLAAWTITWWVTEAVPISITALLPLIGFPMLGVMSIEESAKPYANPIVFLFMGGFMIAIAMEKHRLHERIALALIKRTGTSGNGIILGFMIATAFLSMWISNTATTMMMLPIALSVIKLILPDLQHIKTGEKSGERNFALGLMLAVGYAASIGGLSTIIGTPPNVVFAGLLQSFFSIKISFGTWMLFGVPIAFVLLVANYLIVTKILFRNRLAHIEGSNELIHKRLSALGPLRKEEKFVLIIFCLTSFLWIFQGPINSILRQNFLNDTNIAMLGGLLMFIIPVDFRKLKFLLEWHDTEKMAWGVLLLFGGGLCLASGLDKTGIIEYIGKLIADQQTFTALFVLGLIVIGVVLSELMSNVALVNIFVPVVFGIAQALGEDPILVALPVALSASIGFMFPVATPPNAIVFSSGYIQMKDMVRAGALLNVISIAIIWLASITIIRWVF